MQCPYSKCALLNDCYDYCNDKLLAKVIVSCPDPTSHEKKGSGELGQNPRASVGYFPRASLITGLRYQWTLRSTCPELVRLCLSVYLWRYAVLLHNI